MLYFLVAVSSFTISLLLTITSIKLFSKYRILDVPNSRSNHKSATLRGGGAAIVSTLLMGIIAYSYIWKTTDMLMLFYALLMVSVISFLDDLKNISAAIRAFFQLFAIGIILSEFYFIFDTHLIILLALMLFTFINFYNFMDGIDGSATAETIHISLSIFILSFLIDMPNEVKFISLITATASLGFIKYNWHPAKIFLGDVGSISLGFICGWMLFMLTINGQLAAALILPMYFLLDSGITLLKRTIQRKKIWQAHSEHFYQQAARNGIPHNIITKRISYCNVGLCMLSFASLIYPIAAFLGALLLTSGTLYKMSTK